jgi:hypothetical protein
MIPLFFPLAVAPRCECPRHTVRMTWGCCTWAQLSLWFSDPRFPVSGVASGVGTWSHEALVNFAPHLAASGFSRNLVATVGTGSASPQRRGLFWCKTLLIIKAHFIFCSCKSSYHLKGCVDEQFLHESELWTLRMRPCISDQGPQLGDSV